VRLVESGVLERRHVTADDPPTWARQADVYTPRLSQDELLQRARAEPMAPQPAQLHGSEREVIEHLLTYLGALPDVDVQALTAITALLERAEAAERAALIYQAEAMRAMHRATVAEQHAQLSTQPAPERRRALPVPSSAIYEYAGNQKICRVCGRPAPPPPSHRHDGLRVCSLESCRQEARRRDNVAKQRRCIERKRAQQGAGDVEESR
jgi:hypothetical protein